MTLVPYSRRIAEVPGLLPACLRHTPRKSGAGSLAGWGQGNA
jgi:hypothetical protein